MRVVKSPPRMTSTRGALHSLETACSKPWANEKLRCRPSNKLCAAESPARRAASSSERATVESQMTKWEWCGCNETVAKSSSGAASV